MKPQSAKSKGRILQQLVRDTLYKYFSHLEEGDVRSTSMGAGGEDVLLSPAALKVFPYSVECKSVEKINIWEAYNQAYQHAAKLKNTIPLVVFKRNHKKPLVCVDFEWFMGLHEDLYMSRNPIASDLRNFTHKIIPDKRKKDLEDKLIKEIEDNVKDTPDNS